MDRRQFLITTSVAGLGFFLAVPAKAAEPNPPVRRAPRMNGPYALYGSPRTGCARRPGLTDLPTSDL